MVIGIIIALALAVFFFLYFVGMYNKGISLRNYVKEAFATMDVYMKKRWDLVPNLVEAAKGYADFEKGVLDEVVNLRTKGYNGLSNEEKMDVNNRLSLGLAKLIAVAENYPDLKASEGFNHLMSELSAIEEDIANSRKYYNGCVREFNTFLQVFPANLVMPAFGFKEEKMFEIDEAQRQNVKVSF